MKTLKLNWIAAGFGLGCLLMPSASKAQYGMPDLGAAVAGSTVQGENGQAVAIKVGDTIVLENGTTIIVTANTFLPDKTKFKTPDGKSGVVSKKKAITVGLYGTSWFLGGALPSNNNSTVTGGTSLVSGTILSLEYQLPIKPDLTLTSWYYRPNSAASKDLYQLGLRYMHNKTFGFQAAYLDSSDVDVDAATFQFVMKLGSGACNSGKPWEISLLSGVYYNWADFTPETPQRGNELDFKRKRTSSGLSLAVQGGMQLTDSISLLGSYWFINDRNVNITRVGIGVGVKF